MDPIQIDSLTQREIETLWLLDARLSTEEIAAVLSVPTLHPFDTSAILDAARATGRLITVEEHGWGGLGTMVAEALATAGLGIRFRMLRLR